MPDREAHVRDLEIRIMALERAMLTLTAGVNSGAPLSDGFAGAPSGRSPDERAEFAEESKALALQLLQR